jgi:hypothetical protein
MWSLVLPLEKLKSDAREYVYKTVPGSQFDALAWSVVEGLWDTLVALAKDQIAHGFNLAALEDAEGSFKTVSSIVGVARSELKDDFVLA